jgi:hypothetical protein
MVLEDSLPSPQLSATCLSSEPDPSNPRPQPIPFLEDPLLKYPPHIRIGLTSSLLPSCLPTTTLYASRFMELFVLSGRIYALFTK